jgi:pimeloyl-ACP methyl ester carboxylesterase
VPDTVVLIHGLGRTSRSMWALEMAARKRGYDVINWGYRSTRDSVAAHVHVMQRDLAPRLADAGTVHFVTHSMGGILLRRYLAGAPVSRLGRVVMLAPPNQGSEVADRLRDWWLYRAATGPAGAELTTDERGPAALPGIPGELGVIAGARSGNPLLSRFIGAPNDGKVAVDRTRLPGMTGFLVVPHGHTFIGWQPGVIRQVFRFLETGAFDAHE